MPTNNRRCRGTTLIEVMIVITLLALISAAVGVAAFEYLVRAKINVTRTQIDEYATMLESYRVFFHRYPSNSEGLEALASPPSGPAICKKIKADPWENAYIYQIPGEHNPDAYDLYSYGPDKAPQGGDDIGNWDN